MASDKSLTHLLTSLKALSLIYYIPCTRDNFPPIVFNYNFFLKDVYLRMY